MTPFSERAQIQALLDVEVALAAAGADAGVFPSASAARIADAARADRFDMAALRDEAARAGNLAIPFVRRLTELVAAVDRDATRDVHRGATSQDILDTALVLQLRDASTLLDAALARSVAACAARARRHARTPMAGRTWLQQASPITLGLKFAGWLDLVARSRARLAASTTAAMVVQLGGASGTLAAFGEAGPAVAAAFANRLGLRVPDIPWHTQRDRLADVACALGIVCGALGKIGRDLTLLSQSEVGEVFETPAADRGGSSSMPHKQNPVRAVRAVAAATQAPGLVATMLAAMPQEHERAAGGWQAEWDAMPALVGLTCDAAAAMADALEHLTVDEARIAANLEANGGVALAEALSSALGDRVGRSEAMALVERVCRAAQRDRCSLREAAAADPGLSAHLAPEAIDRALAPANFLGAAPTFVEQVLRRWHV
jgi:3-carboxy-cis,cis-muconate cycloisomerase